MDLSAKTALVFDNGLFQPLAHRLAKEYGQVYYLRDHKHAFPMPMDDRIGAGYEDIERANSWESVVNEVDVFIFPDLYWSDTQAYLRSLGKRVFGCGWGEGLELYRDEFYTTLKSAGMNTVPWVMIEGVESLQKHLDDKENKFVKVSYHRGLKETFKWESAYLSSNDIDDLHNKLGPLENEQWFLVQNELETTREVGSDQIVVDGKFPQMVQYTIEGKDKTGLAMMRRSVDLPRQVQEVNNKMEGIIADYKGESWNPYRGFFSTEIRLDKSGKPYLTDPTCRMASPCGETYMLMCENIGEMIWAAAEGYIVEPAVKKRFAAQAIIKADDAEERTVPLEIDTKVREMVCLYHSGMKQNGDEVILKTDNSMLEIGSVIGLGTTIDEAIRQCRENAKGIRGRKLTIAVDVLDQFKTELLRA